MTFREFVGKMLDDAQFRHEVCKDPKAALEHAGTKPTEQQLKALHKINYESLQDVAEAFGGRFVM